MIYFHYSYPILLVDTTSITLHKITIWNSWLTKKDGEWGYSSEIVWTIAIEQMGLHGD